MADVATLGLQAKFDSIKEAVKALEELVDVSGKAEKGADNVADGMDNLAKESKNADGALGKVKNSMFGTTGAADLLKGALAGAAAAFSVKAIVGMADAWSDMQSRVGAAVGSMESAPRLMQRMVDVANASYSPLSQTVEIYSRNVSVLRDLGRGADEAADFTEALNHALVLTATKGQQAESVQNALSKAMAVGKLQAEGLETILANGGEVAQLLADKLGTTVSGLRQMATDGKITGDVIATSLIGNLDTLRERAEEMPATVGDAFVRIQTNVLATVGSFDQAIGASGALAEALIFIADNMDRIITTAATAAVGFGTYYVGGVIAAAVATGTLTGALALLRAALAATGIGLLVIAAGELVFRFLELSKSVGGFSNAFRLMGNVVSEVWERMKMGASAAGLRLNAVWQGIKAGFFMMVEAMSTRWANFLHNLAAGLQNIPLMGDVFTEIQSAAVGAGSAVYEFRGLAEGAIAAAEGLTIDADKISEQARAPLKSLEELSGALNKAAEDQNNLFNGGGGGGGGGASEEDKKHSGGGGGGEDSAASQLQADLEARLQALRDYFYTEQEMLAQQRVEHLETLDLARQAEMLSQDEYNAYKLMVEQDYQNKLRQLQGKNLSDALGSTSDFFGSMASLTEGGNKKMLAIQKAFSVAQALVNMYLAASQVMADWSNMTPMGKFAAVAAVLAKGASLVASIKGVSTSGGGSASGGGGGGGGAAPSAAPTAPPVSQQQAVEIKLHGEVFNRDTVAELIDKINDMGKDGYNVIVRTV